MTQFEILPGRGLGQLRFGMTLPEVAELLGEAHEREFEQDGEYSSLLAVYSDRGLFLYFRRCDAFQLSSIEIDANFPYVLFGEVLSSKGRMAIYDLLVRNVPSESIGSIQEIESVGQTAFKVQSLAIIFYFDETTGILQEVKWARGQEK